MSTTFIGLRVPKQRKRTIRAHVRKQQRVKKPNVSSWLAEAIDEKMARETEAIEDTAA